MSNNAFLKSFFSLFLLCVSINMSAIWPFDTVIRWVRAREEQRIGANLRAKEREQLRQEIGDENLKKIAQHAEIDETQQNVVQRVFNRILGRPSRNSNNTAEKIAHFKTGQQKLKNKNYIMSEKNERNTEVGKQYVRSLFDRRNPRSDQYDTSPANVLSEEVICLTRESLTLDPVALAAGHRVYKLKPQVKGGEEILSGDIMSENKALFEDAYFNVTDNNHEAARELIESLEAREKMKARRLALDAHYQKYPRAKKNYWSVKQSYDDIIKKALDQLKDN